jgi:hypothetical protein
VNEQLNRALESRIVIEQAKGVVAERAGIDLAEAFVRLRSHARTHNLGDGEKPLRHRPIIGAVESFSAYLANGGTV